jgi:acid phosphatase (class A)
MAEVAPGHQDEIFKRGYEFGESRIIAGYQYASDVAAGRTMAAAIVSRMHADSDFAALLSAAKDEYITTVQP